MMNKLTRKVAIALAAATMTIAATGAIAHARVPSFLVESNSQTSNEIQKVETVDVSVDDCISYWSGMSNYSITNSDLEYYMQF